MNQSDRQRIIRYNIVRDFLPLAMERFLEKNEDYGVGSDEFGPKAQLIDLARKYKKLKAAIWDEEDLTGEPVGEIAEDMIGHLLLLLEQMGGRRSYGDRVPPVFRAEDWEAEYNAAMDRMMNSDG
jgi:hypothetical protein